MEFRCSDGEATLEHVVNETPDKEEENTKEDDAAGD